MQCVCNCTCYTSSEWQGTYLLRSRPPPHKKKGPTKLAGQGMFSMGLDTVISIFSPTDALFLSDSALMQPEIGFQEPQEVFGLPFLPLAISGHHTVS